jgi:L-amino acid N-acyltransferase YncA
MVSMLKIRTAMIEDLPRLVGIYNQAIASHTATADTIPFSVETRRGWFNEHSADAYPIYICENEHGLVAGYLSISTYRNRPALARTAEISYYVDYNLHRQGIGSALLQHALEDAKRIGKKVYLAFLLEGNTPSLRLLEKFGFERWAYLPQVAELPDGLSGQFIYGRAV